MGRRKVAEPQTTVEILHAQADRVEAAHAEFDQRYRDAIGSFAAEIGSAHDDLADAVGAEALEAGV